MIGNALHRDDLSKNHIMLCRRQWDDHILRLIPTGEYCDEDNCRERGKAQLMTEQMANALQLQKEGKTLEQFAAIQGYSRSTVANRLKTAKERRNTPF